MLEFWRKKLSYWQKILAPGSVKCQSSYVYMLVILLNTDRKSILNCLASIALLSILPILYWVFQNGQGKVSNQWEFLNLCSYVSFQSHLIQLHWKKKCGSCREFWNQSKFNFFYHNCVKQCFCWLFSTGREAILSCVKIVELGLIIIEPIKQIEVGLIAQLVEHCTGSTGVRVWVPFKLQLFKGLMWVSTGKCLYVLSKLSYPTDGVTHPLHVQQTFLTLLLK